MLNGLLGDGRVDEGGEDGEGGFREGGVEGVAGEAGGGEVVPGEVGEDLGDELEGEGVHFLLLLGVWCVCVCGLMREMIEMR